MTTTAYRDRKDSPVSPLLAIILAVMTFSFAPTLIKLTQNAGLPSPVIATLRLLLASLLLTPLIVRRYLPELKRLTVADIATAAVAGVFLGLHFVTVITALEHTTVLLNQVIISTSPIWIALMEVIFLKARFGWPMWAGLIIAFSGGLLIAFATGNAADAGTSSSMLGIALSLSSAVAASAYLVLGRSVRRKISIMPYVWILYLVGGFTTLCYVGLTGLALTGYEGEAYFWLLVLTLIPHLLGHSSMNYAVGYLPATLVSLSTQTVVVTGAVVAFLVFAEVPTVPEIVGGTIITGGVILAILGQRRKKVQKDRRIPANSAGPGQ